MATVEQELEDFTQFAKDQIGHGGTDRTIDELFDLWRSENPSNEAYAENVAAVDASIHDFKSGERGTIAGQHSIELCREFGFTNE